MESEPGDGYIRRIAAFIRNNDKGLAEAGFVRRRRLQRPSTNNFNLASWLSYESQSQSSPPTPTPVIFTIDTHRLFYILLRLEEYGFDIGTLDVMVDNPSKPMHYTHINIHPDVDKSDTLSLASFRSSLSAVSALSLGSGRWARQEQYSIDAELKYIYSSFTKIPALSIKAPGPKVIAELADEPPNQNALPLDAFKNIQVLKCVDIDPRTLLGWDRLAETLRSLTVHRSGLEDVADIFIGAVLDDQARRDGATSDQKRPRIPHRQLPFQSTRLPESVPEDDEDESTPLVPTPAALLSPYKWAYLKHLSLADNAITFLPTDPLPYLTSLTHLDLSSNLLVSVPYGIDTLHNLVSLNLSDNMIDSIRDIYTLLGQVFHIDLSHNRLEAIHGLERVMALQHINLRSNRIRRSDEIGRLATLPDIAEVWIEGNPLTEYEYEYRTACFGFFWKEGKNIKLDGSSPGFYERRGLAALLPDQSLSGKPVETLPSPCVVPVRVPKGNVSPSTGKHDVKSRATSSTGTIAGNTATRTVKRIVDLSAVDGTDAQTYSFCKGGTIAARTSSEVRPGANNLLQSPYADTELYRERLQALRSDLGGGWLGVFGSSQMPSPGVAAG